MEILLSMLALYGYLVGLFYFDQDIETDLVENNLDRIWLDTVAVLIWPIVYPIKWGWDLLELAYNMARK